MGQTTPHVLLDVMGTVVYDPFHREVPRFFGMTLDELLEQKHPEAWLRFERSEIEEDEFLRCFFRDGRRYDEQGLKRCLAGSYRFEEGMEELLEELSKRGVVLHLVSNYPHWYQIIEARLRLERFASWTFVSCREGLRKPDPRVFERVLQKLGVGAEQCVLVDDRADNCAAARAAGMAAIQFRGAGALRDELWPLLPRHDRPSRG